MFHNQQLNVKPAAAKIVRLNMGPPTIDSTPAIVRRRCSTPVQKLCLLFLKIDPRSPPSPHSPAIVVFMIWRFINLWKKKEAVVYGSILTCNLMTLEHDLDPKHTAAIVGAQLFLQTHVLCFVSVQKNILIFVLVFTLRPLFPTVVA